MLAFILLTSVTIGANDVDLQTLDGNNSTGKLISLSSKKMVLQVGSRQQEFETKNVMSLSFQSRSSVSLSSKGNVKSLKTKPTVWVSLIDGSQLSATKYLVSKRQATMTLLQLGDLQTSTRNIRSVRFSPMTTELKRVFDESLKSTESEDLIIIRNSKGAINALGGVLGDRTEKESFFDLGGEVVPVGLKKIQGQVYFHARSRQLPNTICIIEDIANQKIVVSEMVLRGQQLAITTPTGLKLSLPLSSIKRLDFSAGKVLFLSHLEPTKSIWQPHLAFPSSLKIPRFSSTLQSPRRDQSLRGGKLQINVESEYAEPAIRSFTKGLSLSDRTTLVYRLPENIRLFKATAGVDSRCRGNQSLQLTIYADHKILLQSEFTKKSKPLLINLKIEKISRLKIIVEKTDKMHSDECLNLCNARIIK